MKIAFLAAKKVHAVRWVNALAERNHQVYLITQHKTNEGDNPIHPAVLVHELPYTSILGYFLNVKFLNNFIKQISPDLLNAHYASGYGTLARLSNFHPLVLSVWGSDIFDFPEKSVFHKNLIAANLRCADWVCSTSEIMADQIKYINNVQNLKIIHFGIDVEKFKPLYNSKPLDTITIGTVKALTPIYGIDTLIFAFFYVKQYCDINLPEISQKLRLLIVGDGFQRNELESLVNQLDLQSLVTFTGVVSHVKVPYYLSQLDIYVAVSRCRESFGVAVLEASACEIPVIVSNMGGLPEVVEAGVTGYVVEKENPQATAQAIIKLLKNEQLRLTMGQAGRQRVLEKYEWSQSISLMEKVYRQALHPCQ